MAALEPPDVASVMPWVAGPCSRDQKLQDSTRAKRNQKPFHYGAFSINNKNYISICFQNVIHAQAQKLKYYFKDQKLQYCTRAKEAKSRLTMEPSV